MTAANSCGEWVSATPHPTIPSVPISSAWDLRIATVIDSVYRALTVNSPSEKVGWDDIRYQAEIAVCFVASLSDPIEREIAGTTLMHAFPPGCSENDGMPFYIWWYRHPDFMPAYARMLFSLAEIPWRRSERARKAPERFGWD